MKNLNTIISEETCLFYGLPGTAILAISLVLSCKVDNDFYGNTFVCVISFLGINILLWLLYLVLFQHLPANLLEMWTIKKKPADVAENGIERGTATINTDIRLDKPSVLTVRPISTEEYQSHRAEFEQKKQEERQNLIIPIMDYVGRVMAPFMEEKELDLLRNEIRAWCDNPKHKPQSVRLKIAHDNKDRLKTISFKHFIWNIAVRLGFENGYSVRTQAAFIKHLFPNELADIEVNSLARSLTSEADKGHIKLDRPYHTNNNVFRF